LWSKVTVINFVFLGNDWKPLKKRRDFFDKFAREMDFNPLNAEKWYAIGYKDIVSKVGFLFFQDNFLIQLHIEGGSRDSEILQ
jgi:hypothetical protein